MDKLLNHIENLKNSSVKKVIDNRIQEFKEAGMKSANEIFKELCFCLLTANYNAEKSIKIQNELENDFLTLSESDLVGTLKKFGHRFPNARAKFILESRKHKDTIKDILSSFKSEDKTREWLVENVKGLGYKEASHFLRNIGYENCAIIDFHIIDLLVRHKLIEKPKSLTKAKYIEIENLLREIASKANLNLAELDLYLWFTETGKVLK